MGPLPPLEGIDVEAGLERVGGNRRLYRELLVKFSRDYAGSPDRIRALTKEGDWDTARRLAHTVKGVAGSIGAEGLEDTAAELETALAESDSDSAAQKVESFEARLEPVLEVLRPVIAQDEAGRAPTAGAAGDPATLRALLVELEPHVEKRRPRDAKEVIGKIAGYGWAGPEGEEVQKLQKLVGKYRFKEARAVLSDLLSRLGDGS